MDTIQIATALTLDLITSTKFCGVFRSDQLPKTIESFPCGFVVNTDPSSEPGTHWMAFYFPSEHKESSLTVMENGLNIITSPLKTI